MRMNTVAMHDDCFIYARNTPQALIQAIENKERDIGAGGYRLAVFKPTADRLTKAVKIIQHGKRWSGRQDIWFSPRPLLDKTAKLAFLFPGLDGSRLQSVHTLRDFLGFNVYADFGAVVDSQMQYENNKKLHKSWSIFEASYLADQVLKRIGIKPDIVAGHSFGEWVAGYTAKMAQAHNLDAHGYAWLQAWSFDESDKLYLAIGLGYESVLGYLRSYPDILLANDNCPSQCVVCGPESSVQKLREQLLSKQVFNQILPFQSAFHTSYGRVHKTRLQQAMQTLRFQKSEVPVWSATTLSAFPEQPEAIAALYIEHLLKPVRFREMIQALYAENNVKAFVQVGDGSLQGFVNDTLKQKDCLVVSAGSADKPWMSQIKRVLAALYVEGKELSLDFLTSVNQVEQQVMSALQQNVNDIKHPVLQKFQDVANALESARVDVFKQYSKRLAQRTDAPVIGRAFSMPLPISIEQYPELLDHALMRQAKGWQSIEDKVPVVPLTMMVALLSDTAKKIVPAREIRQIQNVHVMQWMYVAQPLSLFVDCVWSDADILSMKIEHYVQATICFVGNTNVQHTVKELRSREGQRMSKPFDDRGIYTFPMFHGAQYQGINEVISFSDNNLTAKLNIIPAKGAFLDNVGQLLGLWVYYSTQNNRIAFPSKIAAIHFYNALPLHGVVTCRCYIVDLKQTSVTADIELFSGGETLLVIKGWLASRLEIDELLWRSCLQAQQYMLSKKIAENVLVFDIASYRRVSSWDFIMLRYLNAEEKKSYKKIDARQQRAWLAARIVVKDTVRDFLQTADGLWPYPAQIMVNRKSNGLFIVDVCNDAQEVSLPVSLNDSDGRFEARIMLDQHDTENAENISLLFNNNEKSQL